MVDYMYTLAVLWSVQMHMNMISRKAACRTSLTPTGPFISLDPVRTHHTPPFFFQYQSILPAIAEACAAVTQNGDSEALKGPQLLEALHERSHFGGPDVSHITLIERACVLSIPWPPLQCIE